MAEGGRRLINRFKLSENFGLWEFHCRCCQTVKIDKKLVDKLQALRDKVGVPLVITSGYRCPSHNKAEGGAPNSYHVKGMAADVVVPEGSTGEELAQAAKELGFTGIGVYSSFVHMDVRPGRYVRFK